MPQPQVVTVFGSMTAVRHASTARHNRGRYLVSLADGARSGWFPERREPLLHSTRRPDIFQKSMRLAESTVALFASMVRSLAVADSAGAACAGFAGGAEFPILLAWNRRIEA
jgi:hypothetical protein